MAPVLLALAQFFQPLAAAPVTALNQYDNIQTKVIDPGRDMSADTLASIAPLLILIGERTTKQLLRNIRGFTTAFSLGAAPMGLVTVVSSLVRLSGIQPLRSFLGYVSEARVVAAAEITRVNCGGVHGEVVNGQIVRSTSAEATNRAIGVVALQGVVQESKLEALQQISYCNRFMDSCAERGIPKEAVEVRWCLQLLWERFGSQQCEEALDIIMKAIGWSDLENEKLGRVHDDLAGIYVCDKESLPDEAISALSFACTVNAISEFTGMKSTWVEEILKPLVIGLCAMACIVGIFILELHRIGWQIHLGWMLAVIGYGCIIIATTLAGHIFGSSCITIPLQTVRNPQWSTGVVEPNTAKEGATLLATVNSDLPGLEAVFFNEPTRKVRFAASATSGLLTCAFLCHYLGLRALEWWVCVGELIVCIIAAIARSATWREPAFFDPIDQRLDYKCISTGIITVQSPELQRTLPSLPKEISRLDARAYNASYRLPVPTPAERIAWFIADFCKKMPEVKSMLQEYTQLWLRLGRTEGSLNLVVSYNGCISVKEGLAFPQTCILMGIPKIAAERWVVVTKFTDLEKPLGQVHIPATDSVTSWWTISEGANDLQELQHHMQWAMVIVSVAFFLDLLDKEKDWPNEVQEVRSVNEGFVGGNEWQVAKRAADYFKDEAKRAL
jgi:hypothetical protein